MMEQDIVLDLINEGIRSNRENQTVRNTYFMHYNYTFRIVRYHEAQGINGNEVELKNMKVSGWVPNFFIT